MRKILLAVIAMMLGSGPAHASEVFGGVLAHDIDSPLTLTGARMARISRSAGAAA